MPPTKATSSRQVQLQRGQGDTPETFVLIPEITTFKGPTSKAPQIDATSVDSVAMEFIGGLPDNGEFSFDALFVGTDAQHQGLRADMDAGVKRNFKFTLNDKPPGGATPTSVAFTALVTQAPELAGGVNQVVKGSCTLKISGKPVFTYAA